MDSVQHSRIASQDPNRELDDFRGSPSLEIAGKAVSKNDTRICYVALTFQQARDILWRDLKRTLVPVTKNVNESRLEIEVSTQGNGALRHTLHVVCDLPAVAGIMHRVREWWP